MNVSAIIDWLHERVPTGADLSADSRDLRVGDVFLAYPVGNARQRSDGRAYLDAAAAAGAAAILYEPQDWPAPPAGVPALAVPGLAGLAGPIAAAWYGEPAADMHAIGITGTNGKTSCAWWTAHLLRQRPCALIGTLGAGMPDRLQATGFTTPDAPRLQRRLAALRAEGARAVAMEVSSHALDQDRVAGVRFHTAVFTNLSHDHLDYHGDMAAYEAAKAKLFRWPGLACAVINLDDSAGRRMSAMVPAGVRVIGYATRALPAEFHGDSLLAANIGYGATGMRFDIHANWRGVQRVQRVDTNLIGEYNVANALAVLAVALCEGMAWEDAVAALSTLAPVPGRMDRIGEAPLVVVDYAHTPDALDKALTALRPLAAARDGALWCLFGCGGDRDAAKRGPMGAVAERLADHVVLTSDNPRGEPPEAILAAIAAGMRDGARATQIEDRAAAILHTVRRAAGADVVLVAGKGHETHQEIAGKRIPFSDGEHVRLALAARTGFGRTVEPGSAGGHA